MIVHALLLSALALAQCVDGLASARHGARGAAVDSINSVSAAAPEDVPDAASDRLEPSVPARALRVSAFARPAYPRLCALIDAPGSKSLAVAFSPFRTTMCFWDAPASAAMDSLSETCRRASTADGCARLQRICTFSASAGRCVLASEDDMILRARASIGPNPRR